MRYQNNHVMNSHHPSRFNFNTKVGTLSKKKITSIARACGFEQRQRKIKASELLLSFMIMVEEGTKSYWDWARQLSIIKGKTISKQAVSGRMTGAWVTTVKGLLKEVVSHQVSLKTKPGLFSGFKNVWLQDSTTLHLPDILHSKYKGNVSRGKQKSVAKLNVVMNVLNGYCPFMDWVAYTIPEQTLSSEIINIAHPGDLVIRDLGYFVYEAFKELHRLRIDFLSRLMPRVNLFDVQTLEKINLCQMLKNKSFLDKEVLCSTDKDLQVRLVAIKLSTEQANARRRKARKNRDKRSNYNKEYYDLLGYIIFITSVDKNIWDYKQVAQAYRVRWNIEILFKSWKSGFKIQNMLPDARTKTHRIESILYLFLIYITWFQMLVYMPFKWDKILKRKYLSLIKTVRYMVKNMMDYIKRPLDLSEKRKLAYYCCYESRCDRLNASQGIERFYNALT